MPMIPWNSIKADLTLAENYFLSDPEQSEKKLKCLLHTNPSNAVSKIQL